jgi:uncharacterized protein (DUF342 family)
MAYYLRHYFNPHFNHRALKPIKKGSGSDLYSLGYVQNVINGQILAEIVPLEKAGPNPDRRYILEKPVFPAGPNTRIDPDHPNYLLSAVNGYVFYNEQKITVKHLLNVRQDVSFQTGNIFFVNDMVVHGSVRAGFSVQGNNIRIKGLVEGGVVRARGDLMVEVGARGGAGQRCLIAAGGNVRVPFLEKMELRCRGNAVIDKYCLYCTTYVAGNMAVREQVYGSTINAYGFLYVGKQIGNKAAVPTKVNLGYDPLTIQNLEKIDNIISNLSQTIIHLKAIAGHLPPDASDASRKLARLTLQREHLIERRNSLWKVLYQDEHVTHRCSLMVPGRVYPGVEISIGRSFMLVERVYESVAFRLCYDDIIVEPISPTTGMTGQA